MSKTKLKTDLIPATLTDYPIIQNLAQLYLYDLSRECGGASEDWAIPANGLYEGNDFKAYWQDKTRRAYIVKVKDELAGFVLLNQAGLSSDTDWNVGEFFILARFQGRGVGKDIAYQVFKRHPGRWEVSVLPENKSAHHFWQTIISELTVNQYVEKVERVNYDKKQPKRIIFSFDSLKT